MEEEEEGESGADSTKLMSTGSLRLQAPAMFLDVPGLLFTAAAVSLERDNRSSEISTSETQITADLQQKAKLCQEPVPSLIEEQNSGGVSSCGSGTI